MWKRSASCSTICSDGRRCSASIFRNALVEQLILCASCSCVRSKAFRRRLSHSPKDDSSANVSPKIVSLFVSLSDTCIERITDKVEVSNEVYHLQEIQAVWVKSRLVVPGQ